MLTEESALTAIEIAIHPATDLHSAEGVDRDALRDFLEADLRANLCTPYKITIQEIAFYPESTKPHDPIEVYCVASKNGTRLFYQPASHRFFGAHGQTSRDFARQAVQGSPLACWAGAVRVTPQAG